MTQDQLGQKAGLDRTYVSLVELGKSSPTLDAIFGLCTGLCCTLTELAIRIDRILAESEGEAQDES